MCRVDVFNLVLVIVFVVVVALQPSFMKSCVQYFPLSVIIVGSFLRELYKACVIYIAENKTSRQTDRQTNRRTGRQDSPIDGGVAGDEDDGSGVVLEGVGAPVVLVQPLMVETQALWKKGGRRRCMRGEAAMREGDKLRL